MTLGVTLDVEIPYARLLTSDVLCCPTPCPAGGLLVGNDLYVAHEAGVEGVVGGESNGRVNSIGHQEEHVGDR